MKLVPTLAGLALLVPLVTVAHSEAATAAPVAGWWSRTNVGLPTDPGAPPDVGPTDLYVAGGGSAGASVADAVAAVRSALPVGAGVRSLRLAIKGNPPSSSTIRACAATSDWKPVQGGKYADAPTSDCSKAVTAAVVGNDLVFDNIGALTAPGSTSISIVLLPGTADRVVVTKPTAAAFDIAPVAPAPEVVPPPVDSGTIPPSSPTPPTASAPTPAQPSGPALAAPPAGNALLAPDLASPVARPLPNTSAGTQRSGLTPTGGLRSVAKPPDDRVRSEAALLAILLLAAYTAVDHLRPRRGPQPIGPFARAVGAPVGPVVAPDRGIGRFRRAREGRPARL